MICIENLTKNFGARRVLRDLSFTLEAGQFLTVLGPNGAGKTTLIRIIAALARPTAGRVIVDGWDVTEEPNEVRRVIGLVSHHSLLYDELTARENLRFYGKMYQVPNLAARIDEILTAVDLNDRRDSLVSTFSRGMRQRLAIARALVHNPPLLLLDEPYTGLDPHAARQLSVLLRDSIGAGRTVLLTTHDLSQALALCDRVAILHNDSFGYSAARGEVDAGKLEDIYDEVVGGAFWDL